MSDPTLLSREELERLPIWAMVAFAASCARRVLPMYEQWAAAEGVPTGARRAIEIAEGIAAGLHTSGKVDEGTPTPHAAWVAALSATPTGALDAIPTRAAAAARAAAQAALTAYSATHPQGQNVQAAAIATIREAVAAGESEIEIRAAFDRFRDSIVTSSSDPVFTAFMSGFRESFTRSAPPSSSAEAARLLLRLRMSEQAPVGPVVRQIVQLFEALNAYHIASGGRGLQIEDWGLAVEAGELVSGGGR